MKYEIFPVGPIEANCVLVWDETTLECAVIDPGDEAKKIAARIDKNGLKPAALLCTHAHFDHFNALCAIKKLYPHAPIRLHADDKELYDNAPLQGRVFGMRVDSPPAVDELIGDGEIIKIGGGGIKAVLTPGHSPGSLSYVFQCEGAAHIACGDVIFASGIGRTDLWGGDMSVLMNSIKNVILSFDDAAVLLPGHGPATTVGREKKTNPWL